MTAALKAGFREEPDYAAISASLKRAAADLEKYRELAPQAPDFDVAWKARKELTERAELATANSAKRETEHLRLKREAYDTTMRATGRTKVDAEHWCWGSQTWANGKCQGPAFCPGDRELVPKDSECVCRWGKVWTNGHCCWPGQEWKDWMAQARNPDDPMRGCDGKAQCPQGMEWQEVILTTIHGGCFPAKPVATEVQDSRCDNPNWPYQGLPHAWKLRAPEWFTAYPEYQQVHCNTVFGPECQDGQIFYNYLDQARCEHFAGTGNEWCCK